MGNDDWDDNRLDAYYSGEPERTDNPDISLTGELKYEGEHAQRNPNADNGDWGFKLFGVGIVVAIIYGIFSWLEGLMKSDSILDNIFGGGIIFISTIIIPIAATIWIASAISRAKNK